MLIASVWHRSILLCLGLLGLLSVTAAWAQEHFDDCAHRTESNATIILPDSLTLRIDGHQSPGPFEVAIFTNENKCAGRAQWQGEAVALTAWGASPTSIPEETALHPGDSMHVRIFDRECGIEYNHSNSSITLSFRDDGPHTVTDAKYSPNGIYVVDEITLESFLLRPVESCPPLLVPFSVPSLPHPKVDTGESQSHTAAKHM